MTNFKILWLIGGMKVMGKYKFQLQNHISKIMPARPKKHRDMDVNNIIQCSWHDFFRHYPEILHIFANFIYPN